MLLRANENPNILKWLKKKDDKFTSPVIQNEFLKIMAMKIQGTIKKTSKVYLTIQFYLTKQQI